MNRNVRGILLFIITFALSVATAQGAEKAFDKKFSAAPGGQFIIRTDFGSVEIAGTDANEVSVSAVVKGRQRDVDEFEITATQTANGVEVQGRSPRSSRWFNWGSNDMNVRFTIHVPKNYNLTLETSGGNIAVRGVNGKVGGGTSGGDITLASVAGAVELETSGGNIRADKVEGSLRMETSGGDIRIADVKGDVAVNTSGGNVTLTNIDGKVRAETSGGNITVKVKDSNKGVFAETSGGDIDILLPKDINATVDASTSGGDVSCDFPITMSGKISESRIRGTVNGGGNPIHARTSGGDIRIRGAE